MKYTGTVRIASGQTTSTSFQKGNGLLLAVVIPSAFTTASLTFEGSNDGTTWYDLYEESTEYAIDAVASAAHSVEPLVFNFDYIRIVSSASQGAARDIGLIVDENL